MEEHSGFHAIACESCRNKKSKCDRELPVCSQCMANGSACRYPQINKRGIPSGYIAFIEQRLLETELVVYELLSTLYRSQIPLEQFRCPDRDREAISDYSLKQPKSAKIEEWKSLPLATNEQRQIWWQSKQALMRQRTESGQGLRSQNFDAPWDFAWPDTSLQEAASPITNPEEPHTPAIAFSHAQQRQRAAETSSSRRPRAAGTNTDDHQLQANSPQQEVGQTRVDFPTAVYPLDSGIPETSPTGLVSTLTPNQTETGQLSAHQWRKYF